MRTTTVRAARWVTLCVLATGLLLGAQAATFGGQAGAASSGGVLTIGQDLSGSINPIEFDPIQFNSAACCFSYDWPIYAGLLRETTSGAYVPDLASSVSIPNSTTIDITMRSGLVYSNGTPLDAA
jgi:ABC-type transport system substrate-binding protein